MPTDDVRHSVAMMKPSACRERTSSCAGGGPGRQAATNRCRPRKLDATGVLCNMRACEQCIARAAPASAGAGPPRSRPRPAIVLRGWWARAPAPAPSLLRRAYRASPSATSHARPVCYSLIFCARERARRTQRGQARGDGSASVRCVLLLPRAQWSRGRAFSNRKMVLPRSTGPLGVMAGSSGARAVRAKASPRRHSIGEVVTRPATPTATRRQLGVTARHLTAVTPHFVTSPATQAGAAAGRRRPARSRCGSIAAARQRRHAQRSGGSSVHARSPSFRVPAVVTRPSRGRPVRRAVKAPAATWRPWNCARCSRSAAQVGLTPQPPRGSTRPQRPARAAAARGKAPGA